MTDVSTTWAEVIFRVMWIVDRQLMVYIRLIVAVIETIAQILQPYNIRVAHKPITTLRQLLTNVEDKNEPNDRQGAVYKIKCCDCRPGLLHWWDWQKSEHTTDWTQTGDEKWWCQQLHCWTPFTHESQNWLGLCWMRYLQYGLLQTTHSRKLVY